MSARRRLRRVVAALPGARPAYAVLARSLPGWRSGARRTVTTWQEAGWRPVAGRAAAVDALADRLDELSRRGGPAGDGSWRQHRGGAVGLVAWWLADGGPGAAWLVLAVLGGSLPTEPQVRQLELDVHAEGADAAAARLLADLRRRFSVPGPDRPGVRLVDAVCVDVTTTTATTYTTGIQRVVRETVDRWLRDHPDLVLVRWVDSGRRLVEVDRATWRDRTPPPRRPGTSLVPFRTVLLVPELAVGEQRTLRCAALGATSGTRVGVIGFDCVPVTTAETTALAMGGAFTGALAATREADRVAAISEAAATEYRGWCRSVLASRPEAPEVRAVPLPAVAPAVDEEGRRRWQEVRSALPGRSPDHWSGRPPGPQAPLVLAVGSHEPRKNHEGLLHAAEVLWQQGVALDLVFVGGNAWHDEAFHDRLTVLAGRGRPVASVSALPDPALGAAYADAALTAFLSFNEGFGLPVTESLSVGTPVLTSAHGSMAELAADGGVVTVDPRDDEAVVQALRRLVTDPSLLAQLSAQALARPARSWDDYARESWAWLVGAQPGNRA